MDELKNLNRGTSIVLQDLPNRKYHSPIVGEDEAGELEFLSSSQVKRPAAWKFIPRGEEQTKSMEAGQFVHEWIEGELKGKPFHILPPFLDDNGKSMPRRGKAYEAKVQELRAIHGERFAVLSNTEYEAAQGGLNAIKNYFKALVASEEGKQVFSEATVLAGPDTMAATKFSTPLYKLLKNYFGDFAVKARPDLITIGFDGIKVWDWKKTAKKEVGGFAGQAKSLNYLFSLLYYCEALEAVHGLPVTEINLVGLGTTKDCVPVEIKFDRDTLTASVLGGDKAQLLADRLAQGMEYDKQAKSTGIITVDGAVML